MLDGPMAQSVNKRRKAAIILRYLIDKGSPLPLDALPEDVQVSLTKELGDLPDVDQDTLSRIVAEFNAELEALALPSGNGLRAAAESLSPYLSSAAQNRLRAETLGAPSLDPWTRLAALDPETRARVASVEAPEVGAIWLSKLPVTEAADLLRALSGPTARRIAQTMSRVEVTPPQVILAIGHALADAHCIERPKGFDTPSGKRVADILNSADSATRDAILGALEEDTPEFASAVRESIFTFADIAERIEPKDMPSILRGIPQDLLVSGLAFAMSQGSKTEAIAEFILANISKRLSTALCEEIAERGTVSAKDGEDAHKALVTAIKSLEASGDITLRQKQNG
ncbi:FliG C-terminal domain-containing protein [Marivivens sp. LCG002]|uniref:FliG C-terminal domain-containing protein n=1 Tax=Marivivens sp. LCG002 TaxID=3051171 RepID=UPI0025532D8F|nr:FliG C-terminal domain-containing protein [Marivivens sp. LCG002]WIV49559.1 FliG C-terminal domain-containing protein [Marivivens sp. LCG002]